MHGSTLSRVVEAWIRARRDRERSWPVFLEAFRSDVDDIQGGTTKEGIHLGAMAGTIDLIQRCYTGIETRGDVVAIASGHPRDLGSLHFSIRYRGQLVHLELTTVQSPGPGGHRRGRTDHDRGGRRPQPGEAGRNGGSQSRHGKRRRMIAGAC